MTAGASPRDEELRSELRAAVAARQELGAELEPQVIEGFLDRVEKGLDARIDARLAKGRPKGRSGNASGLPVALGSLGLAIPLSGVAAGTAGLAGLLVCWIGIVLVNFAYNLRN